MTPEEYLEEIVYLQIEFPELSEFGAKELLDAMIEGNEEEE